jgi:hypothetical protein
LALIWLCASSSSNLFLHFSHENYKQKKHTHTHTQTHRKHRQKTFVGLGVLFLIRFDSTWYAFLTSLLPPTTETTRLDARNPYKYSSYLEIKNKSPKETKRCTTWHSTTFMDFELTRGHVYRWRYGSHFVFDFPPINLLVF